MADRRFFLGVLMGAGVRSAATPSGAEALPRSVSLVALIANPDFFDSQLVRVVGFCHLELEGNALFLHREDSDRVMLAQAVQLDISSPLPAGFRQLSDSYVIIEGRFDAKRKGRARAYAGAIGSISRFEYYPSRAEHEALVKSPSP
jgi:hypothetical protein